METQTTETVTFEQRVDRLAKHLLRAGKGHKAAILFAIYASEFARTAAEILLVEQLKEANETIIRIRVQPKGETVDLPFYLRNHPKKGEAVFFIYDIARGGNATQQYLNYRREFFVEDQQRLLFWLQENEIGQLVRNAPDFWAFRGRTLEFLEQPPLQDRNELASDFAYYNWRGDYSQSQEELEAGIRLRERLLGELTDEPTFLKNRAEMMLALAAQHEMAGNLDKSWQLFNEAKAIIDPTDKDLLSRFFNGRGNIHASKGDFEAALTDYREAIQLNPKNPSPYNNRANIYDLQGDYQAALVDYEKAIELDPNHASPFYNRGNIFRNQKKYELALEDYEEAIRLNPEHARAYNNRGTIYLTQKQYQEAMSDFEKALDLNPKDFAPHLNLAWLKMELKKPEDVIQHLHQGLEVNPNERHWVGEHPVFAPLRDDPRFRALVDAEGEEA